MSRGLPSVQRALIVEDEPRFRALLAEVARDAGYESVQAATATEALRAASSRAFDLVLLDLNLPLVDGLAMLEQFRAVCPEVPVIIITGFGDLEAARRAIRLGVSDFLTKPCDLGEIEAAIGRARRRRDEVDAPEVDSPVAAVPNTPGVRPLVDVERDAIMEALRASNGNRSAASRRLGISRRALYNKIDGYRRAGCDVP